MHSASHYHPHFTDEGTAVRGRRGVLPEAQAGVTRQRAVGSWAARPATARVQFMLKKSSENEEKGKFEFWAPE